MLKTKGIPVWEQYLEYIVLAVAAIVFVGMVAWAFIFTSTAVEVQGERVGPAEIDSRLVDRAERLRARISPDAPAPVEIESPKSLAAKFEEQLQSPIIADTRLNLAQRPLAFSDVATPTSGVPFVEPTVPAPDNVMAQQYNDTVPAEVVEPDPLLGEKFDRAPYDITWATAAAEFDTGTVLAGFRGLNAEDDTVHPIPTAWYDDRVYIFDVIVERQEQIDGGWSDLQVIDPITSLVQVPEEDSETPLHQATLRPQLEQGLDQSARDAILEMLHEQERQREIIQPSFYPTRNASWTPPEEQEEIVVQAELTDEQRKIRSLQRRINKVQKQRDVIAQQLADAGGPLEPGEGGDSDEPGRGRSGGGAAPPSAGGGAGPGAGRSRDSGKSSEVERQERIRLTENLKRKEQQLERFRQQLEELVGEPMDDSADEDTESTNLFEQDTIRVWWHDINVEPGKTYRYRVTLRLYNPFFGRAVYLVDEQQHLARDLTLDTPPSEWSDPITIDPPVEIFLTDATPAGLMSDRSAGRRLSMGTATVEIYRFYDGKWWRERFSNVEPGERIGELLSSSSRDSDQAGGPTDFLTNWYLLDIVPDLEPGSRSEDTEAAVVLLQNIASPDTIEMRRPSRDRDNYRRLQLSDEVELSGS